MTLTASPTRWPVRELVAGFDRPGGSWLEARGRVTGPADGAAVIVIGGVSAGKRLFDDETGAGWWPGVAAEGGAIDPATRQILSFDFLGEDAQPFPTIADQAAAALALADAAGLNRFALIGASIGGVTALEIAVQAPDRVRRIDCLVAAAKPNPMATAWRSIQRGIVELAAAKGDGARGVDIARRLAMTTYRTPEEFDQRFAEPKPGSRDANGVEGYLAAAGARYAAVTSPERFLALSHCMDSADVAVEQIQAPVRYLAISSDRLVTPADIERTAVRTPKASVTSLKSLYGHDGFLKEADAVNAFLRGAA
jgi:homoserine O-acetyltransferase